MMEELAKRDWIALTRKRQREEADAERRKEEAKKVANEAVFRKAKETERVAKAKGLKRLSVVIKCVELAVEEKMPALKLGEICLVDLRSNQVAVSTGQLVVVKTKNGNICRRTTKAVSSNGISRIWWTLDGREQDDLDAEVLMPDNYIDSCMHSLAAWAFRIGLEYSVRHSENGRTTCPFEMGTDLDGEEDEDDAEGSPKVGHRLEGDYVHGYRLAVVGLRIPLEPVDE
jgi:hypothetical protein